MAGLRRALLVMLAPVLAVAGGAGATAPVQGLDHVVVVVRDLEAAAATFEELGFSLKPGRLHANGLVNKHVKFPDGTEIELMAVTESGDALAREYARSLEAGEGPVFASLFAPSLEAVAARLAGAGFDVVQGGGLVTFPADDPLRHLFFGGRNNSPTDRPEHFAHANGATSLAAVWLAAPDFSPEIELFTMLGMDVVARTVFVPEPVDALVAIAGDQEVWMLPADRMGVSGRRVVGVSVRVSEGDDASGMEPACGMEMMLVGPE